MFSSQRSHAPALEDERDPGGIVKNETKQALADLFSAYEATTDKQDAAHAAAAVQAAAFEDERKHAFENVLGPALDEMAREIQAGGHGAEVATGEAGEIELRFMPKHWAGTK